MTLTPYHPGGYRHDDDPGEPSTGLPRVSVTDEEAGLLADYARGRTVLEIGTGLGVSTRALASTATAVTTVDVDPWVQATIWPTLPANVSTSKAPPAGGSFGLVFVDADHQTAAVTHDIEQARKLLAADGIIVAHDTNFDHVTDAIAGESGWVHHPTRYGLSVWGPA